MTDNPQVIRPGTIGLGRIPGDVGWWVGLGQWIIGDGSRFSHAFLVLDQDQIVEARSTGAVLAPLDRKLRQSPLAWSYAVPMTDAQRLDVVAIGRELVGTPYSFLDYVYLAVVHVTGITGRSKSPLLGWLRRRVADSGHMMCSQLVDEAYRRAGIVLFDDGRLPQDVTPGDLANLLIERAW